MAITKEVFETLPDEAKAYFIETGEGYDVPKEDVTGLKNKNAELLAELKKRSDITKQFDGLNPEEARKALAEMAKLEEQKLLSKQKFDEVLAKREKEWGDKFGDIEKRYQQRFLSDADKDLQLKAVALGVREDAVEDFAILLKTKHLKPFDDNGTTVWKTHDETETVELEKFIPSLKESKAMYFKANNASGSGASGSQGSSGIGGLKRSSMTKQQKVDYIGEHGQQKYNQLPD
jgi:DNA-directed RNA polymerase subunit F